MQTESPGIRTTIGWAGGALLLAAAVGIAAKIIGVVVAPGARGVFAGNTVNVVETMSGAFAYTLMALLVALVCGASFELARARHVNVIARGGVVAVSGLVVALASPAVVERLSVFPSLVLAVITSVVALIAGIVVIRTPDTRAVGGILTLLAVCGLLRVVAWETSSVSFDRGNHSLHQVSQGFATVAVTLEAIAALLAAAWVGTRSKWRGRVLANVAILLAFALTWVAARSTDSPSSFEAVLRVSLPAAAGLPSPYLLGSIATFLVPATILLAGVALLQPERPAIVASLALVLLSHGSFDVPLHALLVTAGAQWAMLAMTDERERSGSFVRDRTRDTAARPAEKTAESA